jgi:hypothetical protein
MAAGLGFKTFTTGEVLTAADTNGYLMQGILVFASEAARDAAITSPEEGQFAFTKDNNSLWYYSGAAWVASGATGDIEGVTAGTGISGGGTSGTVTITNSMATAIDAKADLVVGTGADTFSVLAVGANGTVLTAASGEATGLQWAAAASGGGMTLLSTTSLTGSSVTVSTIDQTYVDLVGVIIDVYQAANTGRTTIRLNGDTASNYAFGGVRITGNTVAADESGADTSMIISHRSTTANTDLQKTAAYFTLPRYTSSHNKSFFNSCWTSTGENGCFLTSAGVYDDTTAISSITILTNSTFSGGTFYLYGVK